MDKEGIATNRCPFLFRIGSPEIITTSALTSRTVQQRTSRQIIFVPEAEVADPVRLRQIQILSHTLPGSNCCTSIVER